MCIYRLNTGSRYICGKRIPLECRESVCPFGISKWRLLISTEKIGKEKYYWVCKKSGEVEKVEDPETAIEKVEKNEGTHACRGLRYRFLEDVKKSRDGTFEEGLRLTRFADLHLEGEYGKGAKIAIIDSGVSEEAPCDFKISIHETSLLNGEEHGKHIHKIIHRLTPSASISLVQVLSEDNTIPDYVIITALKKCVEIGVHSINLSIQSEELSDGCDPLSMYVNHLSKDKKIAVVIAAGNGGPRRMSIGSPGAAKYAITIGATDTCGRLWRYSSRGPTLDGRFKPDLVAPGVFFFNGFMLKGTSFATPWVTATAAILNRDIKSAMAVRRILHLSARPLPLDYRVDRLLLFKYKKPSRKTSGILRILSEDLTNIVDPRNLFGAGLLDAKGALDISRELLSEINPTI